MNDTKKNPSIFARWLAVLTATVLAATVVAQNPATGSIEGRVFDAGRGGYLERARLTLEGTTQEAFSDSSGYYRFTGVPAGRTQVKVFFTGLLAQTATVNVSAGQAAVHDITMGSAPSAKPRTTGDAVQLEQFVVGASKEMDGAAIAINEQRFARSIMNVVAADEFGTIVDGTPGEVMKFLPGITMDYSAGEARTVSMNGVPSANVPITVGGFDLASAAGNGTGRVTNLDQFSVNSISRIEVRHAPTPETTGSALAGSVNMVPRSAFERSRPSHTASVFLTLKDGDRSFHKTGGPLNEPTRKVTPGFSFSSIVPVNKRFGFTLSGNHVDQYSYQDIANSTWRGNGFATNVAATALTKEFECALANGGHSPSMVAGANNGGRSWTKAQFASIIATGTQIKQKAAWSSASFSICQSSSRPVRIQFSKTTLMMAYNFQFGHEGDNAGIGLEHVIPLRAGQSNLILSPAEIDSLDTYRVATLTTDDQLRLSEVPTNASGPLPTLPILNGADLLARINGLTRFLSHLYDQSADPQRFTSNLLESVPACTLTQGLTTVAQAIEVIIAEKGELSPGPGLDALRIAINKAMAEFTASLRVLASEASLLLGSPSISDRMRLREQLASYLQSAFNPLIERLFGVYDLSFRNLLLAPSSLPSVKPSIAPTGQPSTRDILRAVPAHPRHPCVSGMIYNECTRSDCRYEHDGSKLSASSLTTLLHNLGSLLKGRSVPSEGQGGSRA